MRNNAILTDAINCAVERGFDYQKWLVNEATRPLSTSTVHCTYSVADIIFNHDFAKALWGEEVEVVPEDPYTRINWQYHLQQMVIAADPIKYLGDNLPS